MTDLRTQLVRSLGILLQTETGALSNARADTVVDIYLSASSANKWQEAMTWHILGQQISGEKNLLSTRLLAEKIANRGRIITDSQIDEVQLSLIKAYFKRASRMTDDQMAVLMEHLRVREGTLAIPALFYMATQAGQYAPYLGALLDVMARQNWGSHADRALSFLSRFNSFEEGKARIGFVDDDASVVHASHVAVVFSDGIYSALGNARGYLSAVSSEDSIVHDGTEKPVLVQQGRGIGNPMLSVLDQIHQMPVPVPADDMLVMENDPFATLFADPSPLPSFAQTLSMMRTV